MLSLTILVLILGGVIAFRWLAANSNQDENYDPSTKLGFSYLPLTQKVAAYYGLEVDSGALVTEVTRGGLLDKAGIKPGDVITSFNGSQIGTDAPLLGAMRSCCIGKGVSVEFWSNNCYQTVEIADPIQ